MQFINRLICIAMGLLYSYLTNFICYILSIPHLISAIVGGVVGFFVTLHLIRELPKPPRGGSPPA